MAAKVSSKSARKLELVDAAHRVFRPPATVSHAALLDADGDSAFRETLYLMVTAFGRLQACRDAFGRAADLTGSQFAVLMGTAYTQGERGVTIRQLAAHVQLAATHVTTEVGRLCRLGLLVKRPNAQDGRSVLVSLTSRGEQRLVDISPFVRAINDLLFAGTDRTQFSELDRFLTRLVSNADLALDEIRRTENADKR
ncbi:MAG: MarR family transcriptional regulator [Hyphomicrobiales bacterium]|nr:MarR family transcriptional regulator [Hyphomicrobiales bacterium]